MFDGTADFDWNIPATSGIGPVLCPRCRASVDDGQPRACRVCGASELDGRGPDLRERAADGERVRDLEELVAENGRLRALLEAVLVAYEATEEERSDLARVLQLRAPAHNWISLEWWP